MKSSKRSKALSAAMEHARRPFSLAIPEDLASRLQDDERSFLAASVDRQSTRGSISGSVGLAPCPTSSSSWGVQNSKDGGGRGAVSAEGGVGDGLFRAVLVRLSSAEHVLMFVWNRLVFDPASATAFYSDLLAVYKNTPTTNARTMAGGADPPHSHPNSHLSTPHQLPLDPNSHLANAARRASFSPSTGHLPQALNPIDRVDSIDPLACLPQFAPYSAFVSWEKDNAQGSVNRRDVDLTFWRASLGYPLPDLPPSLLPFRASVGGSGGGGGKGKGVVSAMGAGSVGVEASVSVRRRVERGVMLRGGTLFMGLLATWQSLLHLWLRVEVVRVAVPVARRPILALQVRCALQSACFPSLGCCSVLCGAALVLDSVLRRLRRRRDGGHWRCRQNVQSACFPSLGCRCPV